MDGELFHVQGQELQYIRNMSLYLLTEKMSQQSLSEIGIMVLGKGDILSFPFRLFLTVIYSSKFTAFPHNEESKKQTVAEAGWIYHQME